jgi:hypothetical protein
VNRAGLAANVAAAAPSVAGFVPKPAAPALNLAAVSSGGEAAASNRAEFLAAGLREVSIRWLDNCSLTVFPRLCEMAIYLGKTFSKKHFI